MDWGYLYLAAPNQSGLSSAIATREDAQAAWGKTGKLPDSDATAKPTLANKAPVAALALDAGKVGAQPIARTVMVAYDDEYSLNWMGKKFAALLASQRHGRAGTFKRPPLKITRA